MILEVLDGEAQEPAVQSFARNCSTLTTYYEEIQSMSGAGGRPQPKHFKRRMIAAGGAAGAAGGDDDEQQPPATNDAAPAYPATPSPRKRVKGVPVRVAQRRNSQ